MHRLQSITGQLHLHHCQIGIGVGPRTELAVGARLEVSDGVVTDGRLRTSDPYVWAAGDVASVENAWAGRRLRVEHWANAKDQGAFAGRSLAGAGEEWARPPFFFTDQYDAGMEYWGYVDPQEATLVVRGDPSDGEFAAVYLVDGAVHAFVTYTGLDSVLPKLERLVKRFGSVPMLDILEQGGHLRRAA